MRAGSIYLPEDGRWVKGVGAFEWEAWLLSFSFFVLNSYVLKFKISTNDCQLIQLR